MVEKVYSLTHAARARHYGKGISTTTKQTAVTFRSSASFGKRQEYIAVAELLRRGFDVYMTLVDDQQIDCAFRQTKIFVVQ